jgi:hypothetical protein
MAENYGKKSLPEKKRLVREAIRKLTDSKATEQASSTTSGRKSAGDRHKAALPANHRYTGQDA